LDLDATAAGGHRYSVISTGSGAGLGAATGKWTIWDDTASVYRLVLDSSGNVGIGTTSPSNKLSVQGSADFAGNVGIGTTSPGAVLNVVGNSPANTQVHLQGSGNAGGGLRVFPGGTGNSAAVEVYETSDTTLTNYSRGFMNMNYPVTGAFNIFTQAAGSGTARPLVFGTDGVERMRITQSGNVGIGVSNPIYKLEVDTSGSDTAVFGTTDSGFGVGGYSSSGYGVFGSTSSGHGVHGIAPNSMGYAGYFEGKVFVTLTVCAANIMCAPSDARLKQNLRPLSYGLRELQKLHPVTWQWKDTTTTQLNLGLVAQEVEPVLPELLLRDADNKGSLGLNYMGLIPVLVKGIQEQQSQIEQERHQIEQEEKLIKQQEARLARDEQRIESLKKLICLRHPRKARR
jgi:hypothetical protein